ncbi:MAG: Ig-like domain-containing protein [Bacteroidales bacterium]|nr:Ig-like domain-containing protein [Bacteroidales bacterium]
MKKTIFKVAAAIVVAVLSSAILISCDPEKGDKTIAVSGVSINKTSINLAEGDSETLTATLSPAEATNKSVSWSSSDTQVATVDGSGKVIAQKAGSATITVTTSDGSKTATCSVTVKAIALTKIEISPSETEVIIGKKVNLSVKYTPENASNKDVKWSSSDASVAKVSDSGVVEGVKEGSATITATSAEGGIKATCKVTVTMITKSGVYWTQEDKLIRNGLSMDVNTPFNGCIDLDRNIYYYSNGVTYVNGEPVYQYSCDRARGDVTAAGGGFFFISNPDENRTSFSVLKIDTKKKSTIEVSVYKGSRKNEVWINDMAADSKGNLYIAGNITRKDNVDIATLWKVDTENKVTSTSYSDGTGIAGGPTVDAVAVNKNGDVFCLVYEGTFGSGGYYKELLYKNGKKQYQITENCSRASSQSCDLAVNGNDVYMSICEKDGSGGEKTIIQVYKNKTAKYTLKKGDGRYMSGDIFVTSKGDVYCVGHTGSGSTTETTIWKNDTSLYTIKKYLIPHCMFVKE